MQTCTVSFGDQRLHLLLGLRGVQDLGPALMGAGPVYQHLSVIISGMLALVGSVVVHHFIADCASSNSSSYSCTCSIGKSSVQACVLRAIHPPGPKAASDLSQHMEAPNKEPGKRQSVCESFARSPSV